MLAPSALLGQCPTQDGNGWANHTTVYYSIDSNISGTEVTEIGQAFQNWSGAGDNAFVVFAPADSSHPANWTISNGTTPQNDGAVTQLSLSGTTVTAASTTIGIETLNSVGQPIYSPTQAGFNTVFIKVMAHEIGHSFGLNDVKTGQVAGDSVMNQISGTNDSSNNIAQAPTSCDDTAVNENTHYPSPRSGGCCSGLQCGGREICGINCGCTNVSPILIDTRGEGFKLTSAGDGVLFDFFQTGHPIKMSWTRAGSGNAWLALDRNGDGLIESAYELFGNLTEQPKSGHPNGFLALAEFDKQENGGNGDGIIDARDSVWSRLRLWIDENHDGISQPEELHGLEELGVTSLDLRYIRSTWVDVNGNAFRYRGRVNPEGQPASDHVDRAMYDVFLVPDPSARTCIKKTQ